MFSRMMTEKYTKNYSDKIEKLRDIINNADAIVIGAGAGLSASAGFTYTGERFAKYFSDFADAYQIRDMYSGGFYPFETLEEHWAWWSREIYYNRYVDAPKDTHNKLLELVQNHNYFVITTNVDHCFQKVGFDKKRLFYTQGDYGLWQCSKPCHKVTYDNEDIVMEMLDRQRNMRIPSDLIPRCPRCGKPMSMNLRADNTFVEDRGWHEAANRYEEFLNTYSKQSVLYLELGVGSNTPVIIKYPFWRLTAQNPKAIYASINKGEAYCPPEITEQAICIDGDIDQVITSIKNVDK